MLLKKINKRKRRSTEPTVVEISPAMIKVLMTKGDLIPAGTKKPFGVYRNVKVKVKGETTEGFLYRARLAALNKLLGIKTRRTARNLTTKAASIKTKKLHAAKKGGGYDGGPKLR